MDCVIKEAGTGARPKQDLDLAAAEMLHALNPTDHPNEP